MPVIWKYYVSFLSDTISMPEDAILLTVGREDSNIVLWAIVDPSGPLVARKLIIIPTGFEEVPARTIYVGTVQMPDGLVWHIFDAGDEYV
jgi:hypothetical protein